MSKLPRLNGIIKKLEQGKPAFISFVKPEVEEAYIFGASKFDGIMFEMEHNAWDSRQLRIACQCLMNRKRIVESGSIAPAVTPIVRVPANGGEMNQWLAKQALDAGVYGVVWPHIRTVEEAMNAVSACRYPRPKDSERYEPAGCRGDSPGHAARYWGISNQEYYPKADVWPYAAEGELLSILMIESTTGIQNLDDILREVPGIGCVLIGEGDLSQELGIPRQYDHPMLREAMAEVVARCKEHGVTVGHPHVNANNIQRVLDEGFRLLAMSPTRNYAALEKAIEISG